MYEQIIKESFAKYKGDESVMWASIKLVNNTLQKIKEENPSLYWGFMRDAHEIMQGEHYDEVYAKWEVEQMHHKSPDGKVYKGEYWSKSETDSAMSKFRGQLPQHVNEYDFYVALNASWHDFSCWAKGKFQTEQDVEIAVIELAIAYWFKDDDYHGKGKVWTTLSGR